MIYSDELYVFNADSLRICCVSSQALRHLEVNRRQAQRMYIFDVYPQFDKRYLAELIKPLLNGQQSVLRHRTLQQGKEGVPCLVYLHLELFLDKERRFIHARVEHIPSAHDLDQHRLQMAQYVTDHVSIGGYWFDRFGCIHYANRQACRALGYSNEELLQLKTDALDRLFPSDFWGDNWNRPIRDGSLLIETLQRGSRAESVRSKG